MLPTAVQKNSDPVNHDLHATGGAGTRQDSSLSRVFSKGSLSSPDNASRLAENLLALNEDSPFLTEEQVQQLESILDDLGSGATGEQLMALDRLADILIEVHPGGAKKVGVSLADLQTLDAQVSPLAAAYRSAQESVLNQESPAEQLAALQNFSNLLQGVDADYAANLGLSGVEFEAFQSNIFETVNSFRNLLSTESAKLVGDNTSWASFVGSVKDLKASMEASGLNVEGSAIDKFLSQYGSSKSIQDVSDMDMFDQRSLVASFRGELLSELDDTDVSSVFVPQGVDAEQQQVEHEEGVFALGAALEQDQYRQYLSDAKASLIGGDGSLVGATAESFQSYKSNLNMLAAQECKRLGIPADPQLRSITDQQKADKSILLSMIDGSIAWADKWEAQAGSGSLSRQEAFTAAVDFLTLDAHMFKTLQVAVKGDDNQGSTSELYKMVTEWFEEAQQTLFMMKDMLKQAASR